MSNTLLITNNLISSNGMCAKETSKYLGICQRKLHEMTKSGEIPFYRIGRRVLYSRQRLSEWVAEKIRFEQENICRYQVRSKKMESEKRRGLR